MTLQRFVLTTEPISDGEPAASPLPHRNCTVSTFIPKKSLDHQSVVYCE
jgi:hypothetical protein